MKHFISLILSFLFLISLSSCKTTATAYKEASKAELKEQAAATGTTAAEELATVIGSTSTTETENRNVVIEFETTEYYENEPDTAEGAKPEPTPNRRTADASKPPNVKAKTTKGTITISDNKKTEGYQYDEAVMTRREFEQWQEEQLREIDEMLQAVQEKKKKGNDYGLIVILFLIVAALVSLAVIIKKPR